MSHSLRLPNLKKQMSSFLPTSSVHQMAHLHLPDGPLMCELARVETSGCYFLFMLSSWNGSGLRIIGWHLRSLRTSPLIFFLHPLRLPSGLLLPARPVCLSAIIKVIAHYLYGLNIPSVSQCSCHCRSRPDSPPCLLVLPASSSSGLVSTVRTSK